jgi:succinate dehydrogenase hydrophobic anchor subunit
VIEIFANQGVDNYVALALSACLLVLLVLVLVFPERF